MGNLSLGWTTRIASGEVYSEEECKAMADVCKRQELTPGCSIVFPVAARASCNAEDYLASHPSPRICFTASSAHLHSWALGIESALIFRQLTRLSGYSWEPFTCGSCGCVDY